MERPVVVAGNGPSISTLEPGRLLADDFIMRTNNFFFEPRFYIGRRVDMLFMGGDPRVAPFIFETLHQCRADYDIRNWSTHDPRVARAGRRRFGDLYQPMAMRDAALTSKVSDLAARYDRKPTTGVQAVLMAYALGAKTIILAGIDFYAQALRYTYQLGPHYQALMGRDLAQRGMDRHLHDPELDLDILKALQDRGDLRLFRAASNAALDPIMDMAPLRDGAPILAEDRTDPPTDWAAFSGIYPIELLKILRRGSAFVRSFGKGH